MAEEVRLVFSTFPDHETSIRIARVLVEEGLAACANIQGKIDSIYRWQGKLEQAQEVLCLFKTTVSRYPQLENRIKELHPYELPEIVAITPSQGLPGYLNWVVDSCKA